MHRFTKHTGQRHWQRLMIYTGLLLLWFVLAIWQFQEYGREREMARERLHQQAHSVMYALKGGIRSHRRMGRFFARQLQGLLEEVVQGEDVLAVAVQSADGEISLTAGESKRLEGVSPTSVGDFWQPDGFLLAERLEIQPEPGLPHPSGGGHGRGWNRQLAEEEALVAGRQFKATVLLDRSATDALCRRAALLRTAVVSAGGLVLVCIALAWRTTVRLVEARGQTRILESQARHLRELSQAAAGLAHETRNPLGLIRGCNQQLAQSERLSEEETRQVEAAVEECDRLTARINQFLAFARPSQPKSEAVDPGTLIEQLETLLQVDLRAKNVRIQRTVSSQTEPVQADREMLRQALFNLLQNAIAFSPAGGVVDVQVGKGQDGFYQIDVADRGPGVAEDAIPSLFTPYFTTRSHGTGLGLAIVRRIATAHDWQVAYESREGGGSIFRISQIRGDTATKHLGG
jgi:signal transduction histidine kinase